MLTHVNERGYCWSSTPTQNGNNGYRLQLTSSGVNPSATNDGSHAFESRSNGLPVRCVRLH